LERRAGEVVDLQKEAKEPTRTMERARKTGEINKRRNTLERYSALASPLSSLGMNLL
jgi:hypothetical protein